MGRRKQDCPKRMKWEEELAAAAARELALANGGVIDTTHIGRDFDAEMDQSDVSSSSGPPVNDDDEEDDEDDEEEEEEEELTSWRRKSAGSSPTPTRPTPVTPVTPVASIMSQSPANLHALLAASAAFPGLLSPGSAAAGLLAGLPGFPGLFPGMASPPGGGGGHAHLAPYHALHQGAGAAAAAAAAAAALPATPPTSAGNAASGKKASVAGSSTPSPSNSSASVNVIDFSGGGAKRRNDARDANWREGSPLDLSTVRKRQQQQQQLQQQQQQQQQQSSEKQRRLNSDASDASKALERMTELTRLSGVANSSPPISANVNSKAAHQWDKAAGVNSVAGVGGRQSAWQSHWLSKGADTAKDVLKCVWCKLSFDSLASLTSHMKESKHCGVNASLLQQASATGAGTTPPAAASSPTPVTSTASTASHYRAKTSSASGGGSGGGGSNSDLLLKESVQLPRKLVRGQDVWLGKGAEQTRQILKCMWCGQSFRSLADMTTHMQQTQHYTNIISQEQIISWKAADANFEETPHSKFLKYTELAKQLSSKYV